MIRKLRSLGLAAAAVFAFSASAAPSASADFITETDHLVFSVGQVGQHTLVTNIGTLHCTNVTMAGTINDADTTTDQITITPTYSGCVLTGFGINVNVNMNGCDWLVTTSGQVHIACPGIQKITISGPGVLITIGGQTTEDTTFTNGGSGSSRDLTVDTALTGISYSYSGFLVGTGSGTTGTYNGVSTMKGADSLGNRAGIWSAH